MNRCSHRLDTFTDHEPPWPYIKNKQYHTPQEFANAGFYNIGTTNAVDKVQCYICNITLTDWKRGQSPLARHAHAAATCPLVLLNFPDALSTIPITTPNTYPESNTMITARLKTFTKGRAWPPPVIDPLQRTRSSTRQRSFPPATKMAEAGFVFLPTDSEPDRVKCPYCQRCFSGFNKASNPWTQHEKASPNCTFVTRWRATLPAKKSLIPQKRRINSENKKRSLPSTSKPAPKSNRRATTTGANHIADDDEQEERSRFDDSIWDIAKMQLDHKPNDPTAHPPRSTGTKPLITYTPKKKPHKKLAKMLPPEITKPTSSPATNGKTTADGLTGLQKEPTRSSTPVTHGETPAEVLTRLQKGFTQPSPLTSKGKEKATDSLPSRLSTDDGTMSLRSDQRFLTSEPKTPQHDLMNRMPHSTPKHARNDFWDLTSLTLSPIRSNPFGAFGNNLDTPRRSQQAEEEEEDIAKQIERRFKQKQRYESQPSTPLLDFDDTTTTTGLGITTLLSDQELSMTVEEYLNIMMERKVAHVKQQGASMIQAIRDEVANTKQSILDSI